MALKQKEESKRQRIMRKDNARQSAAFIAKAKEIEADGDSSKADLLMGRLSKMKPAPRAPVKRKNAH
jgi:hypothetical protein